ncbi:MAG: biotin transporter BioY [Archaeoglobaceae archaeon]|nr:biotin transporter BioY [Archaeoglobaceae archaeon]MCX8152650.1 biotin transporter BioY [Archaeoglobaceae archaeon]MDW8014068.1 biotin transporter BioY [Archaeoglobaceae archaeon]
MVNYLKLSLAIAMACITAISAQLSFKIGPVPYTMQNFAVMLSGLILGAKGGLLAVLIYIGMIAIGLPFAAGGGGIGVLIGPTSGYIYGFAVAAFLVGYLKKFSKRKISLWLSTVVASLPIYLLGFFVIYTYANMSPPLMERLTALSISLGFEGSATFLIFVSTVLIFVPQDLFMDHVFAVVVYSYLSRIMVERGMKVD